MGMRGLRRGALALMAACAAPHAAVAWQRPAAQPAPKLEACPEMGEGFVHIPGSSTCVRLSGSVRVEAMHLGGGAASASGH